MQLRSSNGDVRRLSISSAPSSSSQGSGPDDIESLGDVHVWGEIWCEGISSEGSTNSPFSSTNVLLPRPLESNVVLDVHQIACGVRHAALVTRQGEIFTWGEEFGGRLGHGNDKDVSRPRLVESVAIWNMDYVACGEYHTCAISSAGDFFTWGNGSHNTGLLGHGTDVSHWIPKRVSGPLEGIQVMSVACGTWHSALITVTGKVYTFGDGTFGVLGHGDRESIAYPREVESLSGLRTFKVACGVWHTAAIVEVTGHGGANVVSRKLFTWGDGDKYRLGHGDKEARLVPTCVPSLIDYNFHQIACGHSMTVGLTTSGHVFTMGNTIHGQLGSPLSDGKLPCLVQDKLVGELVEEISCGAYHVAVLTSRSEIYTWGKGSNGSLGHGDTEDRKTPTLVEALRDRHVKNISCGSNFTACICIHKWMSGSDQSFCSGCRQPFGFTRKRHNCYNCGMVHCHACSSRKVLKAALAATPDKPHRVCDSCYSKLKAVETGNTLTNSQNVILQRSTDSRDRSDRGEIKSSKILLSLEREPSKYAEMRPAKNEIKSDTLSLIRTYQISSLLQLKDLYFPSSLTALQTALKPSVPTAPVPNMPASPYSRKVSPPSSVSTVFSRSAIDSLKKTNELLNQENSKLQAQVKILKQRCELKAVAPQKSEKSASLAAEEAAKYNAAVDVIKSLDFQLKDMLEQLSPEVKDKIIAVLSQAEAFLKTNESRTSESSSSFVMDASENDQPLITNEGSVEMHDHKIENAVDELELSKNTTEGSAPKNSKLEASMENGTRSPKSSALRLGNYEKEVIEQFEPGVYVTLIQLRDGTKVFRRVRFSKRRFAEQQAEEWWNKNKERMLKKYNNPGQGTLPTLPTSAPVSEEGDAASSS